MVVFLSRYSLDSLHFLPPNHVVPLEDGEDDIPLRLGKVVQIHATSFSHSHTRHGGARGFVSVQRAGLGGAGGRRASHTSWHAGIEEIHD